MDTAKPNYGNDLDLQVPSRLLELKYLCPNLDIHPSQFVNWAKSFVYDHVVVTSTYRCCSLHPRAIAAIAYLEMVQVFGS